jgi:hypothetical protein
MGKKQEPLQRAFTNMIIIRRYKLIAGNRPNEHLFLLIDILNRMHKEKYTSMRHSQLKEKHRNAKYHEKHRNAKYHEKQQLQLNQVALTATFDKVSTSASV